MVKKLQNGTDLHGSLHIVELAFHKLLNFLENLQENPFYFTTGHINRRSKH